MCEIRHDVMATAWQQKETTNARTAQFLQLAIFAFCAFDKIRGAGRKTSENFAVPAENFLMLVHGAT
jgi:hypothetical protein